MSDEYSKGTSTVNVPTEKLVISPMNVRASVIFNIEDEENVRLMDNIKARGLDDPLLVRPVGDKFEIVKGRRRFMSSRHFLPEFSCIVKEMTNEEALKASLSDIVTYKDTDPITRAKAFKHLVKITGKTLTQIGKEMKIPKQTLSDWLKLTELSDKLQEKVATKVVPVRYALQAARLKLPKESQDMLAEAADKGTEFFKKEMWRLAEDRPRRGAPPGLLVVRIVFAEDTYNTLLEEANSLGRDLSGHCKTILDERVSGKKL